MYRGREKLHLSNSLFTERYVGFVLGIIFSGGSRGVAKFLLESNTFYVKSKAIKPFHPSRSALDI